MKSNIVIVGAGQAGLKATEALRALGVDAPIVMIGDEPHLPYQRPPLSKKFLLGKIDDASLALTQPQFFEHNRIELYLGRRVSSIVKTRDAVLLEDGSEIPFGTLILATGSAPRQLAVPGAELAEYCVIRTHDDAEALRDRLSSIESVAVVGGGYVGLEVAASLRSAGKDVTIIEMQDRLLTRALCPVVADHLKALHELSGVTFRFSTGVEKIGVRGAKRDVRLADGSAVTADIVIAAIGGVANDALAATSGIACDNGILVDSRGMTSRPNVFAAGDCARFWSKRYGASIRLESVQNANDQARAVAEAIAGKDVEYDPVPWFWSDQYETKLQMAGLSAGYDRVECDGDPASGRFALTYFSKDRMLAVSAVNNPRAYMTGRRLLERTNQPSA